MENHNTKTTPAKPLQQIIAAINANVNLTEQAAAELVKELTPILIPIREEATGHAAQTGRPDQSLRSDSQPVAPLVEHLHSIFRSQQRTLQMLSDAKARLS